MKAAVSLLIAGLLSAWPAPARAQAPHQHHPPPPPPAAPAEPAPPPPEPSAPATLPAFIPPVTDADRAAAFPDVEGHTVHDDAVTTFVLVDQLEWRRSDGFGWENEGWVGKDLNRVWFRTQGEGDAGRLDAAEVHVLVGRPISPWWDVVAGVRQDVGDFRPQTWAAIGLQGLAPMWFDIEATAYIGGSGRTSFRFDAEYELLVTNRAILQPTLEVDVAGRADRQRGVGAGLSTVEAGLRLRYELRRELAPYVGVSWSWKAFGTADMARQAGEDTSRTRLVVGLRTWM